MICQLNSYCVDSRRKTTNHPPPYPPIIFHYTLNPIYIYILRLFSTHALPQIVYICSHNLHGIPIQLKFLCRVDKSKGFSYTMLRICLLLLMWQGRAKIYDLYTYKKKSTNGYSRQCVIVWYTWRYILMVVCSPCIACLSEGIWMCPLA